MVTQFSDLMSKSFAFSVVGVAQEPTVTDSIRNKRHCLRVSLELRLRARLSRLEMRQQSRAAIRPKEGKRETGGGSEA